MARRKRYDLVSPVERSYMPAESVERGEEGAFPLFEAAAAPPQSRPGRPGRPGRVVHSVAARAAAQGGAAAGLGAVTQGSGFLTSFIPAIGGIERAGRQPSVGVPLSQPGPASPPQFGGQQQVMPSPSSSQGVRAGPIAQILFKPKK